MGEGRGGVAGLPPFPPSQPSHIPQVHIPGGNVAFWIQETSLSATAVAMPQEPRASPGKPQEWKQDMRP